MLLRTVRSKLPRGSALLEAVIAIGVLLAGVVGSLVLINSTIKLGRANQDRIVAQNLAREGIELVYSLRNSAALAKVEDQTIYWDKYLTQRILKTGNIADYENKYEIGYGEHPGTCRARVDADPSESIVEGISTKEATCDIWVLVDHLFISNSPMPPECDNNDLPNNRPAFQDNTNPLNFLTPCDYNKSGGSDEPTIGDIMTMVNNIFLQSYQNSFSYPSINLGAPLDGQLIFADIPVKDSLTDIEIRDSVWNKSNARVYENDGTYVQGITTTAPSKFYRVVSVQSICRGSYDPPGPNPVETREIMISQNSLLNCNDYVKSDPNWTSSSMQKVGGLVTSEVRWPTSTSSTKMKYQEFIYDWINV